MRNAAGVLRITRFIGLNQTLLRVEVNHAIVSLLAQRVDDGHFDAFVGFAKARFGGKLPPESCRPDIATQIPPYQMALILKKDH